MSEQWGTGQANQMFYFPITFNTSVFSIVGTEGLNAAGYSAISFKNVTNSNGFIISSSSGRADITYIVIGH